jgi:hypothetical protein
MTSQETTLNAPESPDRGIRTDTGKVMPHAVLEFKSTEPDESPESLGALWPIKLSRFLWETEV